MRSPSCVRRRGRRGSITVFVLVCLLVMTAICGAVLRNTLAERQRVRAEERRLQAEWLVESGLARASARLQARDDYSGETWDLSAADLGGADPARVRIVVERIADNPEARRVRVQADYPRDATLRARLTKQVVVEAVSPRGGTP